MFNERREFDVEMQFEGSRGSRRVAQKEASTGSCFFIFFIYPRHPGHG